MKDAALYGRLRAAIDALGEEARPTGCVKLAHAPDLYRIRVGDYRVVYQVKDTALVVLVLSIGHRRDIYRR
ncbi:MAG: type II toxin-antitoxin system RelE/ParE family toxin [Verrucomicrobiota bacterium]|nr:type II toxin-antitoxin system RelE/ParE family toxin [Verrucomicrobiota bacterium]